MKLNIKQIEVFAAVMDHGSTIAAALHLHVSQPSVSKHLKLLESKTGVNLFVRKKNRLVPTPEASALYEEVKRTYVGITHLEDFVTKLSSDVKYELGIGSMPVVSRRWLPQVLAKFLRERDHYSVSMLKGTHQTIATWVASGRVDMGLCMRVADDAGVDQELILQLPLVCVLLPNHKKAGRSILSSRDMDGETLITLANVDDWKSEKESWRFAIQDKLDEEQVKPRNLISVSTSHDACELAWRGSGVALVDMLTALEYEQKGMKWVHFDFDFTFDIYLIRPKTDSEKRWTPEFLDELRSAARRLNAELAKGLPPVS